MDRRRLVDVLDRSLPLCSLLAGGCAVAAPLIPSYDLPIVGVLSTLGVAWSSAGLVASLERRRGSDIPGPRTGRRARLSTASWESRFPRAWALVPFILPRKVRLEVYEPACEELKEDYLEARRLARTKGARRWLAFAFTVRTIGLVLGSLHAAVGDRIMAFVWKVAGEATKRLLGG